MAITLTVFIVIFSVFLHELGHALYMRKYGIAIKTFSVGLPFPLKIKFSSEKVFGGATIQLTPLLLGAFVEPTEEGGKRMQGLSYYRQADIYGAGPLANLLFAAGLLLGFFLYVQILTVSHLGFVAVLWNMKIVVPLIILFGLYFGRKLFSRFLMHIAGIALLVLTAWLMFKDPTNAVMGPIGMGKLVGDFAVNYPKAIYLAAIFSGAIGAMNMLPLFPLDGGQSVNAFLRSIGMKRIGSVFTTVSGYMFLGLILWAITSDFVRIF